MSPLQALLRIIALWSGVHFLQRYIVLGSCGIGKPIELKGESKIDFNWGKRWCSSFRLLSVWQPKGCMPASAKIHGESNGPSAGQILSVSPSPRRGRVRPFQTRARPLVLVPPLAFSTT